MDWYRTELGSATRVEDLILSVIPDDGVSWKWSVYRRAPGRAPTVLREGVEAREETARRRAELAAEEIG